MRSHDESEACRLAKVCQTISTGQEKWEYRNGLPPSRLVSLAYIRNRVPVGCSFLIEREHSTSIVTGKISPGTGRT
ncbi:hypothetical protein BOSEA31B_11766 [Hyphomicrobiales bacterium]|nr:hypothetical protein BOSEA31B_11766 [Hyphomicrobiales bacterium]CAH1697559.1 hypothetical protein BOSEA1005_10596 [Hyphomicrobiales bacterium]CAI0346314.1 hypothetical protein BO1005MUT1_40043 [Hyphomicrobiales bacterium]